MLLGLYVFIILKITFKVLKLQTIAPPNTAGSYTNMVMLQQKAGFLKELVLDGASALNEVRVCGKTCNFPFHLMDELFQLSFPNVAHFRLFI